MNLFNYSNIKKSISIGFLTTMIACLFASCSKKIDFLNSSVVPAARGYVQVDKDDNNNYVIHVNVENLAEASRLTPPKKTYIVWLVSNKNDTKNIGQIDSSSKSYAKDLKASFESTSAAKPTKIFITAEDNVNVEYPTGETIITTAQF